jgi:sugar diacid utilization regulator
MVEERVTDGTRIAQLLASELTGLDLGSFDDRLLLYIALQLDEQR